MTVKTMGLLAKDADEVREKYKKLVEKDMKLDIDLYFSKSLYEAGKISKEKCEEIYKERTEAYSKRVACEMVIDSINKAWELERLETTKQLNQDEYSNVRDFLERLEKLNLLKGEEKGAVSGCDTVIGKEVVKEDD